MLYTRDRTETTSQVWLGLTAGCAVCHDHKFDPLSQREFYELAAFFNNTTQAPMDGNIKDTPPIVVVPQAADATRWNEVAEEMPAAKRAGGRSAATAARPEFDAWLAHAKPEDVAAKVPTPDLELFVPLDDGGTNDSVRSARQGRTSADCRRRSNGDRVASAPTPLT